MARVRLRNERYEYIKRIVVKTIENNTINFLDLKSSLLFTTILTSIISDY